MNKIVEAVKEGRKIETKDLISVVNDFLAPVYILLSSFLYFFIG